VPGLYEIPASIYPLTNLVANSIVPRPIGASWANLDLGTSTDLGHLSRNSNGDDLCLFEHDFNVEVAINPYHDDIQKGKVYVL
jgi:hypothetical protein